MIVLDTNVVSEPTRKEPDPGVVAWLDALSAEETAITAITAAELAYGVRRLPDGRRQAELARAVHALIRDEFAGRVLPFDVRAVELYAEIVAGRERAGRPISTADAQIAAICLAHSATLATRNTADFTATGVSLIDPWMADS
ncbi:MAG TPA: type II toxin-antitoxin system VapC family toxin [Streptosporangiaceae bacterium]